MKNKITVIILAVTLLFSITVAAVTTTTITTKPIIFEPNFDSLAQYMGYSTDEEFDLFHKTAVFMGRYCTTAKSFSYIEQMILSGCDPQTTMDIYQFYLTTNEDISIVKQIYDMVYTGEPITERDIVFENAFNKITNNKCGVLTVDDVNSYLSKGLSVSDISQANLLSRKGVLTINQILDSLLSGTSWESIIETISGESISTAAADGDSTRMINAMSVASVTNTTINTVLTSDNSEDAFTQSTQKTNNQLKSKGYWRQKQSANYDHIVKKAAEKGISENKIKQLFDQGHNECDIINALNQTDCTADNITTVTKREAVNK